MRDFEFPLKDFINRGLALNNNKRNNPMLVECIGAIPYEKALQSIEQFTALDVSAMSGMAFPYPQLFVLSESIIVCDSDEIWEYDPVLDSLTLKLGSLPAGHVWDIVDFKSYLALVNGACIVTRDPDTGIFTKSSTMDYGSCLCNFNGQVLMGSPVEIIT